MPTKRVLNQTKGTLVADQVRVARSVWSRFWGLMGRRALPDGQGLLLTPCYSVHTAFMRFPIDVVFLDTARRVVKVIPGMKPFRAAAAIGKGRSALELPAGTAARAGIEPGDQLAISDAD